MGGIEQVELDPTPDTHMANPKRRQSKSRQRMRQGAKRWKAPTLKSCPECGTTVPGHVACPSCGYYRGRQVISKVAGED